MNTEEKIKKLVEELREHDISKDEAKTLLDMGVECVYGNVEKVMKDEKIKLGIMYFMGSLRHMCESLEDCNFCQFNSTCRNESNKFGNPCDYRNADLERVIK